MLDLPSIFAQSYDNGAYAVRIDNEAWADALLRNAGVRGQRRGGDSEAPGS